MTVKDWASLSMSALALIISGTALYFSNVRLKDDLRVVVQGGPSFKLDYENNKFDIDTDLTMTFVNAGTRVVAILGVELFLDQSPGADLYQVQCEKRENVATTFRYNVRAVIVKPGDMASLSAKLDKRKSTNAYPIQIEPTSAQKHQINALGCLRFSVATPDSVLGKRDIPVFLANVEMYSNDGKFGDATLSMPGPHVLLRNAWPM